MGLRQQQISSEPPLERLTRVEERYESIHELMEAKFVTFRTLIDSNEKQVKLALDAADKAIGKSDAASEKRFDSVNEFRKLVNDVITTLVRQDYLEQALKARDDRIDRLEQRNRELELARSSGQGGQAKIVDQRAQLAAAAVAITLVITIVVFLANYITSR